MIYDINEVTEKQPKNITKQGETYEEVQIIKAE